MDEEGKKEKPEIKKKGGKVVDAGVDAVKGKSEALQSALAAIEKQFGKGAVMKLGDSAKNRNIPVITSGILSLDIALGAGGVPRGRIIEVYGPESSGKTTIALHIVAEIQKAGGIAGYIDAEHALDPIYAKKLGVNIDELYISQPDDGEQALSICEEMVRSGAIEIVIIDSVAALVPRAEIEGDMGASHMGVQARLMSQALRKLTGITSKTNCIVLFINQLRDKIGVTFGNPETTTGGRALKFYASVRIDIRKGDVIKNGNDLVGNRTKIKIAKNKVAPPFRTCEFDIMYGEGVSCEGDILDLASELGIVVKSGAWYSYNETRVGQGRENAKLFFKQNPEMQKEIELAVRKFHNILPSDAQTDTEENQAVADSTPGPAKKGKKEKSKTDELTLDDVMDIEIADE